MTNNVSRKLKRFTVAKNDFVKFYLAKKSKFVGQCPNANGSFIPSQKTTLDFLYR